MPLHKGEIAIRWADILPANARLSTEAKDDCLVVKFELNHRTFDMSNCGTIGFSTCYGYYNTSCYFYRPSNGARTNSKDDLPRPYRNDWGGFSPDVQDRISKAQERLAYTEDFDNSVVESLVNVVTTAGYQSVVFTDSINRGTVGRPHSGSKYTTTAYTMDILERKKCGYLLKSPLSLNPAHFSKGDVSIIRHFIWYPPGSLAFKCEKYLGVGSIAKSPKDLNDRLEDCYLYKSKSKIYTLGTKEALTETLKEAVAGWNKPNTVDKK